VTKLWSISGKNLELLAVERLNSEDRLETWLEDDVGILDSDILLIGRQVGTAHGGRIDLLGIGSDGSISIIELKRDKTPRDIVAQVLDYASWVRRLDTPTVYEIAETYWRKKGQSFAEAFEGKFGRIPPEPLNSSHSMIIVASSLDPASQRIVEYLSQEHDIGINTAFFSIFRHGDLQYLSADWLMDQEEVVERTERKVRAPWTGVKYVNAGESEHRGWEDMRRYGFISAGHGRQWSDQLGRLNVGDPIYIYHTGNGYVGFGEVMSIPVQVKDFEIDRAPLLSLSLNQPGIGNHSDDPDLSEYVVAVRWHKTYGADQARTFRGAFATTHIVCRLRDPATLAFLEKEFA
jgi:hypothetical protein